MRQQEGFIFKASGAWYLKYRKDVLENGEVKRKLCTHRLADVNDYCRTFYDARKLAKQFLEPFNEGKVTAQASMSLESFVTEHWLKYAESQVRAATLYGYKRTWERYLKPTFGNVPLRDVRKRDVIPYLLKLSTKTGTRVAKYAKTVGSMIYNYAILLEIVDSNPFAGKLLPKTSHTAQHDTELNEFVAMLTALRSNPQARAVLGLMFFAGLRPSEARGLRWPDYDPRSRQLLVHCSRWRKQENETKTIEATALVPVNGALADLLADLHEHDGFPQDGYILRGERGDSLHLDNLSRRVIAPALEAVGLEWHGYYALRRGAGTMATMVARDRGLAAKGLLRHSSLITTAGHYIDSVPEETRKAVDAVGELFQKCSKESEALDATATKQR